MSGLSMRLLPCGDRAVLVELDRPEQVLGLLAGVRAAIADPPATGSEAARAFADIEELVPAEQTLLVRVAAGTDLARLAARLRAVRPPPPAAIDAGQVCIDVRYDGPDLDEVAQLTGLDPAGVIAAHTGATWTVAFCGFLPGFGYLRTPGDPLAVPRRASPRTRVPVGAVGLGGHFSAVYPRSSPGGWLLIGHTDAALWALGRDAPALLTPGLRVRFRAVRGGKPDRAGST